MLASPSSFAGSSSRAAAIPLSQRLTFDGVVLFILGVMMAASGFQSFRVQVGSLLVHPYLFLLAPIAPLIVISRMLELPTRLLLGMSAFVCIYFVSTFSGGVAVSEGLKVGAAVTTILVTALLVRTRANFTAGVLGLCLASAFLAVSGVEADEYSPGLGKAAMDVANRNVYSLYALPAILLAGFELLSRRRQMPLWMMVLFIASIAFSIGGIIVSLNRSGWLCTALIGLMLLLTRKLRGKWILAILAISALALAYYVYDTEQVERRFTQTWESPERDILRWQLFKAAVEIGFEYPILGVSPQYLPVEIAARLGWDQSYIQSHNVFAHLMGGCGLFCTLAVLSIGLVLWNWPLTRRPLPTMERDFSEAVQLMRMMLILWVVRGMFTHEILFSPGFCMGLGLCIGLCIVASPRLQFQRGRARYTPPPSVLPV